MNAFLKFGIGMLARTLGLVAEQFAQWLFHQVSNGAEYSLDFLDNLREFARTFVRMVAGQFSGRRSSRHYDDHGEEWQPGLYPN